MTEPQNYIRPTDYIVIIKQIRGDWIPNYEEGKIYSTVCSGYLTPAIGKDGYAYFNVSLSANISRKIYLHRALLVMKTGIPFDNRLEVDHINTIKTDNRICNLRWVTHSENRRNRPEKFARAEKIREERRNGATAKELSEKYHYSPRMIYCILSGEHYDPKKYPSTVIKPRLHYSKPASAGYLLRWNK